MTATVQTSTGAGNPGSLELLEDIESVIIGRCIGRDWFLDPFLRVGMQRDLISSDYFSLGFDQLWLLITEYTGMGIRIEIEHTWTETKIIGHMSHR
jgi:hypothetical protein